MIENDTNRRIIITGVTRGLGESLMHGMIDSGHRILGCGQNKRAIEALQQTYGISHDFTVVNVADSTQIDQWAHRLLAEYGPPDLLINNAALINTNAPLWQVSHDEFSKVIDVNIKGVANTIRAFTPAMIERGTGVIVNFSSGWGRSTSPEVAPYCATKWAIEGLTQAFAQELPNGLAAVALNPGVIDTDMLRSCFGSGASSYQSPAQWAKRAVPFLLELDASDNGRSLTVD